MEELGFIDVFDFDIIIKDRTPNKCKCGKHASFGPPNSGRKLTCANCKLPDYIIVGRNRCKCGKTPSFGKPDGRRVACGKCKLPGHVNLSSPKCKCGKFASFGNPIDRKKLTCGKCKLPGYVNLSSRVTSLRMRLEKYIPK